MRISLFEKNVSVADIRQLINEIEDYGFTYVEKDLQGIHFEKVYSHYYQQKGGVSFDDLERGKILIFIHSRK